MKIFVGIIVFNGNYVLKECIESLYQFPEISFGIAAGPVKFWQDKGYTTSTDGTNEIIREFPDPDKKIHYTFGKYSEKDEQCNAYMKFIPGDADYIWNVDSDEIFKPEDVEKLIKLLTDNKYTSVGFKSNTFYGGFDHILTGFEQDHEFMRIRKVYPGSRWLTHRPPTIVHAQSNVWPEKHLSKDVLANEHGIYMYHYSYVFPKQVEEKVHYYKQCISKDNCIDNYFEKIYVPWVLGDEKTKKEIEDKWEGVHEFKPQYRGPCYTAKFKGKHPNIIKNSESVHQKYREQIKTIERLFL